MTNHTPHVWRKSSYSVNGTDCVELCGVDGGVLLRDSKNPQLGHLSFTTSELAAFIAACKDGEFDDLA